MNIGIKDKIEVLRESTGLKKGEFAKLIGKDPDTVWRWIRGDVIPDELIIEGVEARVKDFLSKKDKKV